ncbi:MarR family transcriptional regulator, partial [Mycobacterium sp. E2462]|uniref:MarR family transcriptional regulator n=1 Tax=Mycobacterium sp. E2462 TaxID=1834133 RepID=UPI001E570793
MDVLAAVADSPKGRTSAELAKSCGISTSTCALVLAELQRRAWVSRRDDRRYVLGSGLFGLVHGLREQFPLLDRGREALRLLHDALGAGCSMSQIGGRHLITIDAVGHGTDGEHAVGQPVVQRPVAVVEAPRAVTPGPDVGEDPLVVGDLVAGQAGQHPVQPGTDELVVAPRHGDQPERRVDGEALADGVLAIGAVADRVDRDQVPAADL